MGKLCPKGKAAAKRKFKVYPSAYANMYASAVCSGKVTPGGKKNRKKKADGGRIEKIPGGFFKQGLGTISDKALKGQSPQKKFNELEKRKVPRKTIGAKRKRTQMREGGMVIEDMTTMIEV
jgi:hypothetical protein